MTTTCACVCAHIVLKYCSLKVASKQLHNILSIIKQQVRIIVPCMECYGHAGIVHAFQSIEKKGRIKESPWCSR